MNKVRIFLKTAVILFFIGNTGIFKEMPKFTARDTNRNDPAANAAVVRLCEERYAAATAKADRGEAYSPYEYFRDLNDIYRMEDSLHVNVGFYARHGINELQALSMRFLNEKRFSYDDVEKARESFKDGRIGALRSKANDTPWATVWAESLRPWLVRQYLEGFPFAAVLLLLWIWEGSARKRKFFFRSPVSFVFSLVLYPLVFALVFTRWVRNTGRSMYAEAELRRTKDAFLAILSGDELEAVKRFAESKRSLFSWRKELRMRGFAPKRSLALGFVSLAICFTVFGPHQAFAGAYHAPHAIEIVSGSSGGLEGSPASCDTEFHAHFALLQHSAMQEMRQLFFMLLDHVCMLAEGWQKAIDHIPVSRLIRRSINELTELLTKETDNETILSYIPYRARRIHGIFAIAG